MVPRRSHESAEFFAGQKRPISSMAPRWGFASWELENSGNCGHRLSLVTNCKYREKLYAAKTDFPAT
jgi:hypothetical protein